MVPLHFKLLSVTHSIPGYHDKREREREMQTWSKTNFLPYFAISSLETQLMNLILTRMLPKLYLLTLDITLWWFVSCLWRFALPRLEKLT